MIPNQIAAFKILEQAQQALKSGDKNAARQLSAQAAKLAPEIEEVWLLMAALASPHGSVSYLEKALVINPNSERAIKGLLWAQGRLKREQEDKAEKVQQTLVFQPQSPGIVEGLPDDVPFVGEEPPTRPASAEQAEPDPAKNPEPVPFELPELISAEPPIPAYVEQPEPVTIGQQPVESAEGEPYAQPEPVMLTVPEPVVMASVQNGDSVARPLIPFVSIVVILICLALAWAGWQRVSSVGTFIQSMIFTSSDRGPAWAEAKILKSNGSQPVFDVTTVPITSTVEALHESTTVTPAVGRTKTIEPTATNFSPTENVPVPTVTVALPTFTLIPPTEKPLPTDISLPVPTETPYPVEIVQVLPTETTYPTEIVPELPTETTYPTEIVQVISTPDLGPLIPPSPTPLPTDTDFPNPTQVIPPTIDPGGGVAVVDGARWLDVDLTNQRLYAYEGDTVVNSFLASTGTWQTPTVTGQYHVYVKYSYTDMSGTGFYLPNVPNTMYFYEGYAVHGTYWHNNFGTPMSHGCVNLSIVDSAWVFNFASVGTLVNVHY